MNVKGDKKCGIMFHLCNGFYGLENIKIKVFSRKHTFFQFVKFQIPKNFCFKYTFILI